MNVTRLIDSGAFVSRAGYIQVFLQQPGDKETILHLADQSDVWPMNVAETKQNRMSDFEALQLTTYNNTSSRLAVSHKGYDVLTAL